MHRITLNQFPVKKFLLIRFDYYISQ